MAVFSGQTDISAVDLLLPATATILNLPTFTCYLSMAANGPWIVVPFSTTPGGPMCGVLLRIDGRVEIRLRNWTTPSFYYVTAAWR